MKYKKASVKHNKETIFVHFGSIFEVKIHKKILKNTLKRIELLVFCVKMYFQLKSTSLGYVQTDVDHHMVKEVEQYIEYFKNFKKNDQF